MTRAAIDAFNPQVFGARANGDTVIAGLNGGAPDHHISRQLNVDAIRIRTIPRSYDLNPFNMYILATVDHDVEHLAVQGQKSVDPDIVGVGNAQCLHSQTMEIFSQLRHSCK